jgi:hypothetical protein
MHDYFVIVVLSTITITITIIIIIIITIIVSSENFDFHQILSRLRIHANMARFRGQNFLKLKTA